MSRKKQKKINSRHRLVFNKLPEGEEWALKVIFHPKTFEASPIALNWNFSPNCNKIYITHRLVLRYTDLRNIRTKMLKTGKKM